MAAANEYPWLMSPLAGPPKTLPVARVELQELESRAVAAVQTNSLAGAVRPYWRLFHGLAFACMGASCALLIGSPRDFLQVAIEGAVAGGAVGLVLPRRRPLRWLAVGLVALLPACMGASLVRDGLVGLYWGEHFFRLRPTHYWRGALADAGVRAESVSPWDNLLARLSRHWRGLTGRPPTRISRPLGQLHNPRLQMFQSSPGAVPVLLDLLQDPDGGRRGDAAQALGEIGPVNEAVVLALGEAANDPSPNVRYPALCALAQFGPEARAAVPQLIKSLRGDSQRQAVITLGAIGPEAKAAIPVLLAVGRENQWEVLQTAVRDALDKIDPGNGSNARPTPSEQLKGPSEH